MCYSGQRFGGASLVCVCVNIDFSALWEGLGLICCWGTSHEVCKGPEDLPSSARHRCLSPPTHTTNTHAHTDELLKNLSSLGRETYMPEAQILKLLHSHISYSTQSNHIQYSYKTFKVYNNIKNGNCYHKRYKVRTYANLKQMLGCVVTKACGCQGALGGFSALLGCSGWLFIDPFQNSQP